MKFTILGTGSYLPEQIVTNDDMGKIVETSDEWMRTRTGIESRHYSNGESVWYMGTQASIKALRQSGLSAEELDAIIVTSVTPDYMCPTISCIIQAELGAVNAFCIDINVACSGYIYALDMAANYLANPKYKNILVVGSEMLTCRTNFEDRTTCVLFGDAASATIVSSNGDGELLATKLGADGTGGHTLISGNNQPRHPFLPDKWKEKYPPRYEWESTDIYMAGNDVYRFAVTTMPQSIVHVLEEASVPIEEMSYLIPHQANYRILEASAKRLRYPMEQVYTGLRTTGNTSSAGLGVGIDECLRDGTIKKGDIVGLTGFGGGLTYGAMLIKI